MTARTSTLEPLGPVLIKVSLVHLLVVLLVGGWLLRGPVSSDNGANSSLATASPANASPDELWLNPADFLAAAPAPVVPPAANASAPTAAPAERPSADSSSVTDETSDPAAQSARYITLSRLHHGASSSPSAPRPIAFSAQDLSELDRLDEALYEAFMRAWRPPGPTQLDRARRSVRLDVTLAPDVTIVKSDLAAPSGSSELDLSVLAAAEQVTALLRDPATNRAALKFPAKLPSSLQNSRYDCRILFQLE